MFRISVQVAGANEIPQQLREELERWEEEQFGHLPWQWSRAEWYAIARVDSGHLAGKLEIVKRTLSVGGERAKVAGVGGVVTRPEFRRQGVAAAMLTEAARLMREELLVEFGLLLCQRAVAPVYPKSGWVRVDGPTIFWQPSGVVTYPYNTMILPI
jgi:aminoglycoside 2'-N-acetyltransferase I